jgi:hypothetical protein
LAFNPDTVDRSVLVLNALLGLGTALAPVLVAVFVGLGFWWGLPILSTVLLLGLLLVSLPLPLRAAAVGAQLRLVVTAEAVRRVLTRNGLDRLFPIYPSLEAATAMEALVVPLAPKPGSLHVPQPRTKTELS